MVRTVLVLVVNFFSLVNGDRLKRVNRASELVVRSQTVISDVSSSPSPLKSDRSEQLDVEQLNRLIRRFDKSWILPRSGSKEPVGSNFQHKKTCANIFKARHAACQQFGFGIMCFNCCHEQGEKMDYRCQDVSNAAYCRRYASFDAALAKHKKDPYKAKAHIHQMISRCYATSVCNEKTGLLNSSLVGVEETLTPQSTISSTMSTFLKLKMTAGTITKLSQLTRRTTIINSTSSKSQITPTTMASLKTNASERTTLNSRSRKAPRLIPIWQKLLVKATTELPRIIPTTGDIAVEEEKQEVLSPSTTTHQTEQSENVAETSTAVTKKHEESMTTDGKRSWKSHEITTSESTEGDIPILGKRIEKNEHELWMRYQPGKWFQSIQHLTNMGRK